ncbi:MAG: sce7726 family protein [Syntrophomonas sp.]
MTTMEVLESCLTTEQLKQLAWDFQSAYQSYMFDYQVWSLIEKLCPSNAYAKIKTLRKKVIGHTIINDLIMKYYPGERVIKYHFIKKYLDNINEVCVFEMNVNKSRVDISRINGKSMAYEIKTELDSLTKLEKQMLDYSKVFEFSYVLIHEKHLKKAKEILPLHSGIIIYELCNNEFTCWIEQEAEISPLLDKEQQIKNLTSKDIQFILKSVGEDHIPSGRSQREAILLDVLDSNLLNEYFKIALKKRFSDRWSHLQKCFNLIQPIDMQVFFNTASDPKWLYYKNSSMV